jgi:hypothetical protein
MISESEPENNQLELCPRRRDLICLLRLAQNEIKKHWSRPEDAKWVASRSHGIMPFPQLGLLC